MWKLAGCTEGEEARHVGIAMFFEGELRARERSRMHMDGLGRWERGRGRLPFGFDFDFLSGHLPTSRLSPAGDRQGRPCGGDTLPNHICRQEWPCCAHLISVTDLFATPPQVPLSLFPLPLPTAPPSLTGRPRTRDDTLPSTPPERSLYHTCPTINPPAAHPPPPLKLRAPLSRTMIPNPLLASLV